MKLQKRDCRIKVHIEPLGVCQLGVDFDFGDGELRFTPSSAMGGQFGDFVSALYTLYHENSDGRFDGHSEWHDREYHSDNNYKILATTVTVSWDGEGPYMVLEMKRELHGENIILRWSTDYKKTYTERTVDGRDFCYAVAKACTEELKQFGFYGYRYSTGGEPIALHQLLFLKAYALGNMEARKLTELDPWLDCCKSDFKKEMELLLFDM